MIPGHGWSQIFPDIYLMVEEKHQKEPQSEKLLCVLLSVALAPTGRTIFRTAGAAWQFCTTRSEKWAMAQLPMNFDRRYALCIQNLYHKPHFTVSRKWNKRLRLQPLQWCYCDNSGNPASACVISHYCGLSTRKALSATGGERGRLACRWLLAFWLGSEKTSLNVASE